MSTELAQETLGQPIRGVMNLPWAVFSKAATPCEFSVGHPFKINDALYRAAAVEDLGDAWHVTLEPVA